MVGLELDVLLVVIADQGLDGPAVAADVDQSTILFDLPASRSMPIRRIVSTTLPGVACQQFRVTSAPT